MRLSLAMLGRRQDRGAAIVWSLALVTLLLLVGLCTMAVASLAVARQHAAAAADVAALAGVEALADPCGHASGSALANGVELASCTADGPDLVVEVEMPAPGIVHRLFALLGRVPARVTAWARAGPP